MGTLAARLARPAWVRPALLTAAAGLCAMQAHRWSGEAAQKAWLEKNPPSALLVAGSVHSLGWGTVTDGSKAAKLVRWLPTQTDPGGFWLDREERVAAYFPSLPQVPGSPEWLVLTANAGAPPKEWESLGRGWTGFESLLRRLSGRPPRAPLSRPFRRPTDGGRDPREFIY